MTTAQVYFPQLLAMVALSFAVALWILITRVSDLVSRRKPVSYYEDWDGAGASVAVMRPTRQLANLFEFPVLFYTGVVLIIVLGVSDAWLPALSTLYVVFRWAHALAHLGFNRLWVRTPIFMLGQFVLLAIWLRLGWVIYN